MYQGKSVGVVVPAYNEGKLIGRVLETMPEFVDSIIVVNDCSTDSTEKVICSFPDEKGRIVLINHRANMGLGASLIDGYQKAKELHLDIVAVMAGDAQMAPSDLSLVIEPVAKDQADYVKGNRLLRSEAWERMPKHRYFGNNVLTLLSKFATGYWHIIDPQCGYTAISGKALAIIPIDKMIKGYGYNAHILNMLNLNSFRVKDIEVEPIYGSEKSKIKLFNYIPKVSALLLQLYFKRMFNKYALRDFNPLILFYGLGFVNIFVISVPLSIRFLYLYFTLGEAPMTTLTILTYSSTMGLFSLFFGMWLDIEDNRRLRV